MINLYWVGLVGLIGLIVVTIVLLARPSQNLPSLEDTYKLGLQTHFVNEQEVPAFESPLAAGLAPRSQTTT
jgi:hypothetical protein